MDGGFIKIYRKLLDWEWHDDPYLVALWVHLLLEANWEDKKWHGKVIKRGQMLCSLASLAEKTGLSVQQTRTRLERLEQTGEINKQTTNKWTLITICNFDKYQVNDSDSQHAGNKQITNKQQTNNKQITTPKEIKKERNKENIISSSLSSSFTESVEAEIPEEEKEKILKNFFFRNLAAPEKEASKFYAFNNGDGRDWSKMSPERKEQSLTGWQQVPHQAPRFKKGFLEMWNEVYGRLAEAPAEIRLAALSDKIAYQCGAEYFIFHCSEKLKAYIEQNLDELKPIIWPFVVKNRCRKITYKIE